MRQFPQVGGGGVSGGRERQQRPCQLGSARLSSAQNFFFVARGVSLIYSCVCALGRGTGDRLVTQTELLLVCFPSFLSHTYQVLVDWTSVSSWYQVLVYM